MKSSRLITHPIYLTKKPQKETDTPVSNIMFQTIDSPFVPGEGILTLKKTFSVDKDTVSKITVKATALGIFDMYLNGKRVGEDENGYADEYKPGWTDYRIRAPVWP